MELFMKMNAFLWGYLFVDKGLLVQTCFRYRLSHKKIRTVDKSNYNLAVNRSHIKRNVAKITVASESPEKPTYLYSLIRKVSIC